MGEINAFELPDRPSRMPTLYVHGIRQLRCLDCKCDDPWTSQGCHLVIDLPDGWSFHSGPDWVERYLSNPESLRVTLVRDSLSRPRAMIIEKQQEDDDYPRLYHIEVLCRFAVRKNQQEHAFVLDRADEEKLIANFIYDGGANYRSACDWLAINYPEWHDCFAYWYE